MRSSLLAVLGCASTALAAIRGFNYGAQGQTYSTFKSQFQTAASLSGASDFTSARLYTMIQEGTTNTPTSAIQAAIDTKTTLLLGLWASQDQSGFNNELAALQAAVTQYGTAFTNLVVGISVGSEDLYRISPTGIAAKSGVGQSPSVLVDYISQTRKAIAGGALSSAKVGHVDTWNVFVNGSNSAVITAADFLGLDEYPYYQTTDSNSIDQAGFLFFQAYDRVQAVAGGKPIWVTESGWPVSGPTSNLAIANTANAAQYWQSVACALENRNIDMWWYILSDAGASPSFGVSSNGSPLYSLSCNSTAGYVSSSSSASSTMSTSTGSSRMTTLTAGATMTMSGSTTVLSSATVVAVTSASSVSAGKTTGSSSASTSASKSSSASASTFTGAASKMEGSAIALAIGAIAAVLAL